MTNSGFADTVVNGMLSWLKGFAAWVLKLFDLAGSGGISPLRWLSDHWLHLLIFLLIAGSLTDLIIWLIRWRPYWVWFRKKRVVVEDEDFFAGEKLAHAGLYDASIFGRDAIRSDMIASPSRRKKRKLLRRDAHKRATVPPRRPAAPHTPAAAGHAGARPRPQADKAAVPPRRRPAAPHRRPEEEFVPPREHPDIFEDEMFRIESGENNARQLHEDEVFNVSNLPGAQPKKWPDEAKRHEEEDDDDLFAIH